jgi:hypothetical protein
LLRGGWGCVGRGEGDGGVIHFGVVGVVDVHFVGCGWVGRGWGVADGGAGDGCCVCWGWWWWCRCWRGWCPAGECEPPGVGIVTGCVVWHGSTSRSSRAGRRHGRRRKAECRWRRELICLYPVSLPPYTSPPLPA